MSESESVGTKGKLLVVAAHPDDEILGAGATISWLASEGWECRIAILGEGMTSRGETREAGLAAHGDDLRLLQTAAHRAGRVVGAESVDLFDLPDNRFDSVALLDVVKIVLGLLDRYRPTRVFTHHPGDLNVDHGVCFRATLTALRPLPDVEVPDLYCFEVPSSTEYGNPILHQPFAPTVFSPVRAEDLERKVAAMAEYESEARPFPHPRSGEALRALAQWRGANCGHPLAEAFQLVRRVGLP
jgi:LmbE family N-acetylglucosaminyl deacetylase